MKPNRALTRYFLFLLVAICIAFSAQAADQNKINYRMGTTCQHDSDCFEGCRTGTEQVNCINTSEGVMAKIISMSDSATVNNGCVIRTPRPPGGLGCYCSPDAHVCGYAPSGSGN